MNTRNDATRFQNGLAWLRWIATWLAFPLCMVALAFAIQGKSMAEKIATDLIMPVSMVWWLSFVWMIRLWRNNQPRQAWGIFVALLLTYLTCAPITTRVAMGYLEAKIPKVSVGPSDPLDTVVVLGGGTSEAPDGRAQLAQYGDRVGLAMQLYHQGIAKHLVVTGDPLLGFTGTSQNDPSMQAKRLLMEMGVPELAIEELAGSNTSGEMQSLKSRPDLWRGKRCGLITSAFHMPRAIGLAKRNGIDLLPIAADYRVRSEPFNFRDLLPSARGASLFDMVLREFLGTWVGR